jgi:energy-converting hydrogenase Eha subunit A
VRGRSVGKHAIDTASLNLFVGWIAMLLGVLAGAWLGLFFHIEDWAGGYASYRRRMLRLAHIAFFGLGFINLLYALSLERIALPTLNARIASVGFVVGVISMPLVCYLSAWRKSYRHLFPIPVIAVGAAILAVLLGWRVT